MVKKHARVNPLQAHCPCPRYVPIDFWLTFFGDHCLERLSAHVAPTGAKAAPLVRRLEIWMFGVMMTRKGGGALPMHPHSVPVLVHPTVQPLGRLPTIPLTAMAALRTLHYIARGVSYWHNADTIH